MVTVNYGKKYQIKLPYLHVFIIVIYVRSFISPWLDCIRSICIECGLSGVWQSQTINNVKWLLKAVEQRLKNLWISTWYRNVTTKSICGSYMMYKEVYGIEEYLVN